MCWNGYKNAVAESFLGIYSVDSVPFFIECHRRVKYPYSIPAKSPKCDSLKFSVPFARTLFLLLSQMLSAELFFSAVKKSEGGNWQQLEIEKMATKGQFQI